MSRYSGAAGKGASRTLAAVRRAEAETRQAAYDALGARRDSRRGKPEPPDTTEPDAPLYAPVRLDDERTYSRWIGDAPWQR